MRLSKRSRWMLRLAVAVGPAFIYIPLIVIGIYAFNSSKILEWPPPGLTTDWFSQAVNSDAAREAFFTSLKAGVVAGSIALIAGGLLAFALPFDEIIVTSFTTGAGEQTLPIWIYSNLFRRRELPIVNAVAVIVILISIIPVYLTHRLGGDEGPTAGRGAGGNIDPEATAVP